MNTIILLFTLFNSFGFIMAGLIYFKKNYRIVDIETYQAMMECVEEVAQMEEQNNQEPVELPGGEGFFREYVEGDEDDSE